ncbi:hypothetical protein TNCV_1896461 [Trichonephila clavipes]|nr:hypothetical protein TNCV_1896461 [Trichonephila clavipes]
MSQAQRCCAFKKNHTNSEVCSKTLPNRYMFHPMADVWRNTLLYIDPVVVLHRPASRARITKKRIIDRGWCMSQAQRCCAFKKNHTNSEVCSKTLPNRYMFHPTADVEEHPPVYRSCGCITSPCLKSQNNQEAYH